MSKAISADDTASSDRSVWLPRRTFVDDVPDKGLFGIVAAAGFIMIFTLKYAQQDQNVIAGIAVALMLGYGIAAYSLPSINMRPDRLGDNFYYLGFIFTLASLSVALHQMQDAGALDGLIGSFGIALVTTIVGIVGRVVFVQMRGNLDDVEEQARLDLVSKSQELNAQLSACTRDFETMRHSLLQTLEETTTACAEVSQKQTQQIDAMVRTVSERMDASFKAQQDQRERLNGDLKRIAESVDEISRRAASMELPSESLNNQLSDFASRLDEVFGKLADTAFKVQEDQRECLNGDLKRIAENVDEISRRAASMELPSESLNNQLSDFASRLDEVVRKLGLSAVSSG